MLFIGTGQDLSDISFFINSDAPGSLGLPRCKNLTRFSLFVSFCFAVRYCLKCFCVLCFTSSMSFTGSYTEVKPGVWTAK